MTQSSHSDSAERARATRMSDPLAAVRGAVANGYTLVAVFGQKPGSGITYLAREDATSELVAVTADPNGELPEGFNFVVARELDPSLPGPRSVCPSCTRIVTGWQRICDCGRDLSGIAPASAAEREALAEHVRQATAGEYEILGNIPYVEGGLAWFGEQHDSHAIVALRLHAEGAFEDGTVRYALAPTEPLEGLSGPAHSPRSGPVHFTPAHAFDVVPDESAANGDGSRTSDEHRMLLRSGLGSGLMAKVPTPLPDEQIVIPKVCPSCGSEYETGSRFCPRDGMALRPRGSPDPLVGRILADRYHVLKKLGEGGMGRVYLGEHVKMNRQCAIKVMSAQLVNDSESARRFAREASSAARIIHPNVAAVFDYGESDGLVYIVMEYVDGEPLSRILDREKSLPPHRALDIARQVADGLGAAHELGIIHRDLKPDNIMVGTSRSGREVAKVVDFGIAKAVQDGPPEALTRTGLVIGTPEYMSPEQLLGDPVDARSDIYSLGCILFQMLTGSATFDASTREQMITRRLTEDAPRVRAVIPELPESLERVLAGMLARAPSARYSSAAEARELLVPSIALGDEWDPSFKPTPRSAPTVSLNIADTTQKLAVSGRFPARRRRMRVAAVGGAGAVLVAAGFALASLRGGNTGAPLRTDSVQQSSIVATAPESLRAPVGATSAPKQDSAMAAGSQAGKAAAARGATTKAGATTPPKAVAPPVRSPEEVRMERARSAVQARIKQEIAKRFSGLDSAEYVNRYGLSPAAAGNWRRQFTQYTFSDDPPVVTFHRTAIDHGQAEVDFTMRYRFRRTPSSPSFEDYTIRLTARFDELTTGWQLRRLMPND